MLNSRTLMGTTAALLMSSSALAGPAYPKHAPSLEPSNPNVGECYARVKIPAQYQTGTETVVTRDAHTRLKVQQAELATRTEQVMTKEPSVRYVVRQPRYETVVDQLVTRPAYDKLSVSEPRFQTVTETLQTSAPRLVWKLGNPGELARQGYKIHSTADAGYQGQGYTSTTHFGQSGGERCGSMCEIWCLVEEPGDAVTVTRQVMTSPGEVIRTRVPHQTQSITRQIVADPGGVDEIPVPAEYRSVTVQDIVRPAREALIEVPAEYGTVETRTLVEEERYEWRQVVCAPGTAVGGVAHHGSAHISGSSISATPSYSSGSYGSGSYSGGSYASGTSYSSGTTYTSGTSYSSTTKTYPGQTTATVGQRTVTGTGYYGVDDWDTEFGTTSLPNPTYDGPAYNAERHTPKRRR